MYVFIDREIVMEKKMNICFIVSEICNKGPVNVVLDLAKEYIKKHFEVTLIALRPSATEYEKHFIKYGIEIIYLDNKKKFNLFKLAKKLKMVLNSKCNDILHSYGFIADALKCKKRYFSQTKFSIYRNLLFFIEFKIFKLTNFIVLYVLKNKKNKITIKVQTMFRHVTAVFNRKNKKSSFIMPNILNHCLCNMR